MFFPLSSYRIPAVELKIRDIMPWCTLPDLFNINSVVMAKARLTERRCNGFNVNLKELQIFIFPQLSTAVYQMSTRSKETSNCQINPSLDIACIIGEFLFLPNKQMEWCLDKGCVGQTWMGQESSALFPNPNIAGFEAWIGISLGKKRGSL